MKLKKKMLLFELERAFFVLISICLLPFCRRIIYSMFHRGAIHSHREVETSLRGTHITFYVAELLYSCYRVGITVHHKSYVNEIVATVTVTLALHCEIYVFYHRIKTAYYD